MRRARSALTLIAALSCWPAAAQQDCTVDPQLTDAAAELLLAHDERPSPHALSSAVREAGSDSVGVHALFVPANAEKGSEQHWLASLRPRIDGDLHCGRADNAAGRLLIAVGRGAALEPIDGQARIVRGRLHAGFRNAELVIETADAQLLRVGVDDESLRKGVELAPDLSLPLKVQLVARGPSGPRPVAEREVRAPVARESASVAQREARAPAAREPASVAEREARAPAARESASVAEREARALAARESASVAEREARAPAASVSEREVHASEASAVDHAVHAPRASAAERVVRAPRAGEHVSLSERELADAASGAEELSRSLLALRAQRGRGRLRANRLLREAASQHAHDVCAKGRVAHEVEAGDGPDERLARAGLDARVLGETIARADSTASALDALKNSPSHLYTLLDPRFTDFGIGVAQDSAQKYCYVVLLCAWPRYVGKRR